MHVAGAGTDAVSLWLQVPLAVSAALVLGLLAERLFGSRRAPRTAVEGTPRPAGEHPPRRPVERVPVAAAAPAPVADGERVPVAAPLWSRVDAGSSHR